ncbi:MAG: type II toxin-antitoxin system RelE/ParE family toxin [Desulfobacterales bacterium]|jgi:mRNA-degrading endonuclease RelE of RelBE toxin-antitoxin system
MAAKFKLIYSATSRRQIKKLHPHLKPIVKAKIESIGADPYIGKLLEKELSGYLSYRARRYRIIYKVIEDIKTIEIHYIGHRKDIYELFGDQLRELKERT